MARFFVPETQIVAGAEKLDEMCPESLQGRKFLAAAVAGAEKLAGLVRNRRRNEQFCSETTHLQSAASARVAVTRNLSVVV